MGAKYHVKVSIDQNKCIACGTCSSLMPEAFEFDPTVGKNKPTDKYKDITVDKEILKKLKDAAAMCPTQAIKVEIIETFND